MIILLKNKGKYPIHTRLKVKTFDVILVPLDVVESHEHRAVEVGGVEVVAGHLSHQWPGVSKEGLC